MNIYTKFGFGLSLLVLSAAAVIAYVSFGKVSNLLAVHFDVYRGIDFFGTKYDVFGILAAGLAILTINFLLAALFSRRDNFFVYLFAGGSVFLTFLILAAILAIISVN